MKNKALFTSLAIALAGAGVVGSAVFAANQTQPQAIQTPATTTAVTQAPPDAQDGAQSEEQESQALQAKAKITADQAKQIAQSKTGGTATNVSLGDENGTVVYEVTVGNQDVKVNAIDGSILKIEASDGEQNDDNTKTSATHDNGQPDQETNDDGPSATTK